MLVCLLGLSACGKDYVANIISEKYNLNRIVQFTTRPIRTNEKNGIDYNFIDEEQFIKFADEDVFISYRVFKTYSGDWYYGITRDSLENCVNGVMCIDIEGLEGLLPQYSENILSVFIDADYNTRKCRAEKRSNFDINEFDRRYKDDLNKINRIKETCNYIVDNNITCLPELYSILNSNLLI